MPGMKTCKILFFGDLIGSLGRKAVIRSLPDLRAKHAPDFVVANVENLSHGRGISPKTLRELDAAGVDCYTSGNHVWENEQGLPCFSDPVWKNRLIRPGNMRPELPGLGHAILERNGCKIVLVNVLGQLFMEDQKATSPFAYFDEICKLYQNLPLLVDFHAEATSEKEAFGHYADGRAAAVLGTHTHVSTADAKILPNGTAYVTDVGRSGGYDSVVGFEKSSAVRRFLDPTHKAYDPQSSGAAEANAVMVEIDLDTKRALSILPIHELLDI